MVEDDPVSRRTLVRLLKLRGFETIVAESIAEAVRQLPETPKSILLDLMLPDGSGVAVLDEVRNRGLPIRIAVTTGAGNWEDLLSRGAHRPDAVFHKPLDFERVVDWLNENG